MKQLFFILFLFLFSSNISLLTRKESNFDFILIKFNSIEGYKPQPFIFTSYNIDSLLVDSISRINWISGGEVVKTIKLGSYTKQIVIDSFLFNNIKDSLEFTLNLYSNNAINSKYGNYFVAEYYQNNKLVKAEKISGSHNFFYVFGRDIYNLFNNQNIEIYKDVLEKELKVFNQSNIWFEKEIFNRGFFNINEILEKDICVLLNRNLNKDKRQLFEKLLDNNFNCVIDSKNNLFIDTQYRNKTEMIINSIRN